MANERREQMEQDRNRHDSLTTSTQMLYAGLTEQVARLTATIEANTVSAAHIRRVS